MSLKDIRIITKDRDYWKKLCGELSDENFRLQEQIEHYRELLTSPIMKDLIRLEDKGQFLPSDKREQFSSFKWDIKALESESDD